MYLPTCYRQADQLTSFCNLLLKEGWKRLPADEQQRQVRAWLYCTLTALHRTVLCFTAVDAHLTPTSVWYHLTWTDEPCAQLRAAPGVLQSVHAGRCLHGWQPCCFQASCTAASAGWLPWLVQ